MGKTLLALDLGTTSVKAGIFSPEGKCLASAAEEYLLVTPEPDIAELPPETYWEASVKTIREVIGKASADREEIAGISISSQGETIIILDEDGNPLRNAIVWIDNRAVAQAEKIAEKLSGIYDVTGIPDITPMWPACKMLWIKENEPEIYSRIRHVLLVQDYIVYKLTGKFVTNGSISCTTLYFDIVNNCWWDKALEAAGIDKTILPEIQDAGEIVGLSSAEANDTLGLSVPIPVIGGGMDQSVCAIGAGTIKEGIASETTGSALCIQVVTEHTDLDKNKSIPVYMHSIPGKYLFVPVCPTAGMAYKWFKDTFAQPESETAVQSGKSVYDLLNELAGSVPAGCDGLVMLPHLMGAFCPDSHPSWRGSFTGFTIHHTKGHFIRAIQEAVAFMLRRNLERVMRSGIRFSEIRLTGGGSKSAVWNQIKADVCDLPAVILANEETGLAGDAILVGKASGIFESIEEGCQKFVEIKDRVLPGPDRDIYETTYKKYCSLEEALGDYFDKIQ